ncbi:MAG: hypothetical protein DWI57_15365 [Chloroflexi bacterium]|nr:MAG: hypothetical protein DWI57_15365 [Chloroflexota bacterium]
MILSDILDSVRQLSQNDKLALIEATARMLRQSLDVNMGESGEAIAEVTASYIVDRNIMTIEQVIESVKQLSDGEKLAVIEATARMLRQAANDSSGADAVAEAVLLYGVEEEVETAKKESAQWVGPISDSRPTLAAIIEELMSRPDPTPEQMLKRGLLKGVVYNEEDFRAAEWHPSDEELENAGLSVGR